MKGIVAEIHGSYMIVIAKNGDFIRCKKLQNCNIGDEVQIPVQSRSSFYKKVSTLAASFLIMAMLTTGVYAYYTPYSYVSVDINPSLELYVNRFEKVIEVHAFNEEAEKLLKGAQSVKNKGIDTALEQIIDSAADQGYLQKDAENSVMIVVSSNSKKEEKALSSKISKTSTEALAKVSSNYDVILEKTKVDNYKKAKEENISPGKVILANEFKEAKPDIDEEQIKHMPLQQAIKEIEKKDDQTAAPGITAMTEKPEPKVQEKSNVKNVRELIKERNEELGKKLERDKNSKQEDSNKNQDNNRDNDKNNNDNKNKDDDRDQESFKQKNEGKDKDRQEQNRNDEKDDDNDDRKGSDKNEDKKQPSKKDNKNRD